MQDVFVQHLASPRDLYLHPQADLGAIDLLTPDPVDVSDFGWYPIAFEQTVKLFSQFGSAICLLFFGKKHYVTLEHLFYLRKQGAESQAIHLRLSSVEMLNAGFQGLAVCGKVSGANCRSDRSGTTALAAGLHRKHFSPTM